MARAAYHGESREKLKRFAQVMTDGMANGPEEHAAVAMRNYMLKYGAMLANSQLWTETFLRVQNSIKAFVNGRPLQNIKAVKEEIYPLISSN